MTHADTTVKHAMAAPASGPILDEHRLLAIDATRGLALLGIFMVNIQLMAFPLGSMLGEAKGHTDGWLSQIAWHATNILAESRSFPLFSMLFGMGMAMQFMRAMEAGRRFWPTYQRRLIVLAILGLMHAFLLWFGDILFYYAVAGSFLPLFARCRVRTLITWAVTFYGVTWMVTLLFVGLAAFAGEAPDAATSTAAPVVLGDRPLHDLFRAMKEQQLADPEHPIWVQAERKSSSKARILMRF